MNTTSRLHGTSIAAVGASLMLGFLVGCGGSSGGGGGGSAAAAGDEVAKPGGGTFFVDVNQGGSASQLRIVEMFWARLVDVHDVDANGDTNVRPVFADFPINENIQSDGDNYLLETNPITEQTRLVILRTKGAAGGVGGSFDDLLTQAVSGLPSILPKNDDGTDPLPYSFISRNAALMLRFDDVLDDSQQAETNLIDTVRVLVGYPPTTPFAPRILFDPNHGAVVGGRFHTTRVLIDMTVSQAESADMSIAQPVNSLGLPASLTTTDQANVSVRIPARVDAGAGQFAVLTNLAGAAMATDGNGPIDASSPTIDIVRAMRAGNPTDLNNGFLLDLNSPEILGTWGMTIESAAPDPAGDAGFDFVVQLRFLSACQAGTDPGDILSTGDRFLEVTAGTGAPDDQGRITNLRVRSLSDDPLGSASTLLGTGLFLSTYDPFSSVATGCWVSFAPQPTVIPVSAVSGMAQILVRFSEPMDPASLSSFDTFLLVEGDSNTQPIPTNIVIGAVSGSADLRDFVYTPLIPYNHVEGVPTAYHIELKGPNDLAGNRLAAELPSVDFTINPLEPTAINGGVALRFTSPDELEPIGASDLRGQFFFDLEREIIKPRPVTFTGVSADRINPVPSIMIPFPPGVQTPLSPFGSKLQTVWRYADLGWQIRDETKYNVDVIGLNWKPIGGQVLTDFYEEFEVLLSHSRKQPDEDINSNLLPKWPNSGLFRTYADNVYIDPRSPQIVAHPRSLGYIINPANLFVGSSGSVLMPFPMNRAGLPTKTYTWRDTAALNKGAGQGAGVPLDIEVGAPLFLDNGPAGDVAPSSQVPSFGLPLLMEFRCFPSDSGVGLNAFDISLAINSSVRPNFRAYSTGGINSVGTVITKNPSLQLNATGGFNPGSTPPGRKTKFSEDNSFYVGQLDIVIRVSRVHTIWIDTQFSAPTYFTPILNPGGLDQPDGTQIILEYRAADSFSADADNPFDAQRLDPYGDLTVGNVSFFNGDSEWFSDIRDASGARYYQTRISFINNISTGLNAELSAIGFAFEE